MVLKPFQSELELRLLELDGKGLGLTAADSIWPTASTWWKGRSCRSSCGGGVGCICVQAAGETCSTSHSKKKPTRQNPASISLRPFSLLDAEIGNDATTYWGVSYVLSTLAFTWSAPILIKVIWVTCYPQSIGEETETVTHDRQLVKPDPRKTPSSAWPMARVPGTVEWVVAHTLVA